MIMINIYFYLNITSNCKHINYLKNSYIKRNNDFFVISKFKSFESKHFKN